MRWNLRAEAVRDITSVIFLGRVLAQACVFVGLGTAFLPPMQAWYSGLLPYPTLLVVQCLILLLMVFLRQSLGAIRVRLGPRAAPVARGISVFAWVYVAANCVRLAVFVAARLQGSDFMRAWIPIPFHWVLAAYLLSIAALLRRHSHQQDLPLV